MNSPESFYLHLSGAQQGPYTIPQIDHLLNSGLIGEETLYWCEGLDQWQPVTTLVPLRKKPKLWVKPAIVAAILLALALPVWFFGPVLVEGWHEANQHAFTESGAYWRARDLVRADLRGRGVLVVDFAPLSKTEVTLRPPDAAQVRLRGTFSATSGKVSPTSWIVGMHFDPQAREWTGALAGSAGAP